MDYRTAMTLAQYSCACTIDHWREAMPTDGKMYSWDEDAQNWLEAVAA